MLELEKDEQIVYEIRRHPLVFYTEIAAIIFASILPLLVAVVLMALDIQISFLQGAGSLFTFFYALWLLVMLWAAEILWTSYFLDIWVVTTKKIIDVEQEGLFGRRTAFLHLDRIQDITVSVRGLLPTILKYGDISVQTAAQQGEFFIHNIPHPKVLHQKINEAIKYNKEHKEYTEKEKTEISIENKEEITNKNHV